MPVVSFYNDGDFMKKGKAMNENLMKRREFVGTLAATAEAQGCRSTNSSGARSSTGTTGWSSRPVLFVPGCLRYDRARLA
ncbi:MAG: hypothetical protein JSW71_09415 [Gemmatimonadota bacterium]|nr:MAG: hypothetical protein JSW71_09415 [Gemmatimonadota bacterium]